MAVSSTFICGSGRWPCLNVLAPLNHPRWHLAHDHLHHGEMLQVVMRLEEGVSGEEFHKDAAD